MEDLNHLYGTCACERNQYTVVIPTSSAAEAQVFFDNSAANRRSQASPVTAWLRIPLDWYSSSTHAHFPDETHASIKRAFNTPTRTSALPPTRKQFCGYCGTHLTAWNEGLPGHDPRAEYVDVTLGSLLDESLEQLERLRLLGDEEEEGAGESESDVLHERASAELSSSGVEDNVQTATRPTAAPRVRGAPHSMTGRGMPYFEELVENSRFGRIKRQTGGHTSADGTTTVQWEVTEINGDDEGSAEPDVDVSRATGSKRMRLDV